MTEDEQVAVDARVVEEPEEILGLIELHGFRTYELSGRRRDGLFPDVAVAEEGAELIEEIEPVNREMQVYISEDHARASVRIRIEVEAPLCVVTVDMAVLYTKNEPFMMGQEAKGPFIQQLAVMNLWPFVRQHVADVSQRLDAGTTIGLMRSGLGQLVLNQHDLTKGPSAPAWVAEQATDTEI